MGAVGGSGVTGLFNWLQHRGQSKSYVMGAVDHAVETALESVTSECKRLNGDIASLRAEHARCLVETNEMKAQIADLMKAPSRHTRSSHDGPA